MKPNPTPILFLILPLAIQAGGCATSRSALMVPIRPSPMHTLKDVPPAKLRIPLVIALPKMAEVEKHLAQFMKTDIAKAEKSLTKSLGTTVWWDPLAWEAQGNSLTAHMHVHYKNGSKVSTDGQAPETFAQEVEKDMKLDLSSALNWSKDWHMEAPDFKENTIGAVSEGLEENDDGKGKKLLKKGTSKFEESLQGLTNIKAKAKEMWEKIQEPIPVGKDIWLQILPRSVGVGNNHIVPDSVSPHMEAVLEISASPKVFFGKKPSPLKSELPPLEDLKPGPDGFHAQSNLKISFDEANKMLTDPKTGILHKPLPGSSARGVQLTGLRLYGSGGQVVVEAQVAYQPVLNLSGSPSKLTVYLLGTPTYHEKEQIIDFPDLDFDVKSDDFLVQMATFIDGDGMKEQLREKAVIPVGKKLDEMKGYLTKMLNRPLGRFAQLQTTVTSLRMEEAFVSDYGIEVRVALDGDAQVSVNW